MDHELLKGFAREVMATWPDSDLDSETLQDIAVRHRLLVPENRTSPCGAFKDCACAQFLPGCEMETGFVCYRKATWLRRDNTLCPMALASPDTATAPATSTEDS